MLAKFEGKRRRGRQRVRWSGSFIDSTHVSLSKLWEMPENREAWLQSMRSQRVGHDLVAEQQQGNAMFYFSGTTRLFSQWWHLCTIFTHDSNKLSYLLSTE